MTASTAQRSAIWAANIAYPWTTRALRAENDDGTFSPEVLREYWYSAFLVLFLVALALAIVAVLLFFGFKKKWHQFDRLSINNITESWILNNKVLLGIRIAMLAWILFIWGYCMVADKGFEFFDMVKYYTLWNFSLLTVFFTGSIVAFIPQIPAKVQVHLARFVTICFNVEVTLVFLVDLITWGVLYPYMKQDGTTPEIVNFSSFTMHGVNWFFMVFELLTNRIPMVPFHVVWVVLWGIAYCSWALVLYCFEKEFVYMFLNLWTEWAIFWYVGCLILHILFFALCLGIYNAKLFVARRLAARRGVPLPEDSFTGKAQRLSDGDDDVSSIPEPEIHI